MKRRLAMAAIALVAACSASGGSGSDGGGIDLGGGTGGGTGGGGGSAALYPLAVGYRWSYTVTAVGAGSVCAAGRNDQHVLSANAAGGRPAFQFDNFCTGVAGTDELVHVASRDVGHRPRRHLHRLLDRESERRVHGVPHLLPRQGPGAQLLAGPRRQRLGRAAHVNVVLIGAFEPRRNLSSAR